MPPYAFELVAVQLGQQSSVFLRIASSGDGLKLIEASIAIVDGVVSAQAENKEVL